jgi:hypothetical protein
VEVKRGIVLQGENQPHSFGQAAFLDMITAALRRQIANANSRMLVRTPEILLNVTHSFADLLTFRFR